MENRTKGRDDLNSAGTADIAADVGLPAPLTEGFASPGKQYRPSPFWSWNGRMTPERVKHEIRLLKKQGFGGYFMHSRIGLITPYLSNEWMAAVRAGVETARELDMEAWLYDEDKWPSGFAGGIVPALNPEYRQHGLRSCLATAQEARAALAAKAGLQASVQLRQRTFIYELEWSASGRLSAYRRLDTGAANDAASAPAAAPPERAVNAGGGKAYLISEEFTMKEGDEWYNGECYVDLLNPRVTQAFLNVTHEAYRQAIGESFGPHVPGIFTDEPNFRSPLPADASPWTPSLPQVFQELHGFDLLEHLPLLFFDGEGAARVRYCYWQTLLHLFLNSFTVPYSRWCEQHGIAMTGHYLNEDSLISQTTHIGAAMPHYVYQQLPGIDHLGRNIHDPWTLKQVSSVAHQTGKPRVLCEIFGTAGHSMSFADQKWIADLHFALGVNFMNQHLTLYSMTGERKRDYPANISWAQPYWPYYRMFNDYAARAAFFTSQGKPAASLLLIHPVGSAWALLPGFVAGQDRRRVEEPVRQLDDHFRELFSSLLAHQRDFDLGDETIMAEQGTVTDSFPAGSPAATGVAQTEPSSHPTLVIGQMSYSAVVVPAVVQLEASTLRLLTEFARRGGPVILTAPVPQMVAGEPHPQAWRELLALPSVFVASNTQTALEHLDIVLARDLTVLPAKKDSQVAAPGSPDTRPIVYQHRQDGLRHYYFLASTDRHQAHQVRLRFPWPGTIRRWDLLTGNVVLVGHDLAELEWEFPAAGSLCLTIDVDESPTRRPSHLPAQGRPQQFQRLNGPWEAKRLHPNLLVLDFCRLAWGDNPLTPSTPLRPVAHWREEVLRASGRKAISVQPYIYLTGKLPYKPLPVVMEFPFYSSVSGPSPTTASDSSAPNVSAPDVPASDTSAPKSSAPLRVELVAEQMRSMRVWVNGVPLQFDSNAVHSFDWDPDFEAVDISSLVRAGENQVRLEFTSAADGPDVEEIYLAGDFQVQQDANRYPAAPGGFFLAPEPSTVRLAAGDWGPQGYPFYSGTMRYRLNIPASVLAATTTTSAATQAFPTASASATVTAGTSPGLQTSAAANASTTAIAATSAGRLLLRLVEPVGASLFAVRVGGQEVAVLPWEPWEVDLTPWLPRSDGSRSAHSAPETSGSPNSVDPQRQMPVEIDVVSSLRNSLGPLHHREGDNLGWTGPGEFRPGPHWTDEYHFAPYGLTAVELLME